MRFFSLATMLVALLLGAAVHVNAGQREPKTSAASDADVQRWIGELSSKNPLQAAAAAYRLGRQAEARAVPQLVAVLGDNRPVDPSLYREEPPTLLPKRASPGQEAAAALANIGQPAVEPLIRILQTDKSAIARQNAAWALGRISEVVKPAGTAVPRTTREQ